MPKNKKHPVSPSDNHPCDENIIAGLAYRYYEEEGRPEGQALDHWFRAKGELQQSSASDTAAPPRAIEDSETEEEVLDQNQKDRIRAETK